MDLAEIRKEIDQIDVDLITLLEKRMALVSQVALYKRQTGKAVLDIVCRKNSMKTPLCRLFQIF